MPPARRRDGRTRPDGDRDRDDRRYEELPEVVRLHEEYLKYRVAGGEPPTPELYRKALESFRQLPGAIRSKPGPSPPPPPGGDQDQSPGASER
jgi:hypothetical protein